ncbi:MAG: hypothetical protein ILO53_07235 [Clostridia bacterium]|nr:hypothetical protein [Clostridia bacterium]
MKKTIRLIAILLTAGLVLATASCATLLPGSTGIPLEGAWSYSYEDSAVEDYYWLGLMFPELKESQMTTLYEYVEKSVMEEAISDIISSFTLEFDEEGNATSVVDPEKFIAAKVSVFKKLLDVAENTDPSEYGKILSAAGYDVNDNELATYLSVGGDFLKGFVKSVAKRYVEDAEAQTPESVAISFGSTVREDGLISASTATYDLSGKTLTITTAYSGVYTVTLDYDKAYKDGVLTVGKITYSGPGSTIENQVDEISMLRIHDGMALEKAAAR